MAQEPSSRELLDAVKQQESGGRRYKADGKTLLEGPQTKYGTAKGEMQVLDMTNKDPGFGVRPAKDDSPDERARVGEDYFNAMVKRYGKRETALVAYNWGPGNTDKWLDKGGDFDKLPEETQNYVTKITGSLGSTKVAQAAPKAAPAKAGVQKTAFNPMQNPMFAQLGANYQAAFAVSMLADEGEKEGKSEDEPSESSKMLTEATARPVALAQADLGYQSPFPQQPPAQQPVKMAAGGVPTAMVRPTARAELDAIKAEYDVYAPKAAEYNTALEKYKTDVYNPYQTQVDAYNAALEKYKAEQFNPYQAQVDAYNAALGKYKTDVYDPYQAQVDKYNADLEAYNKEEWKRIAEARRTEPVGRTYRITPKPYTGATPVAPAEFSMATPVAPAQFGGVTPTKPAEFSVQAPTAPSVSQAEYDTKAKTAKADTADRQLALTVAMNPEAYGLSMPKFDFNMPTFMADGGQVSAPYGGPVYRAAGSPETGEYFQDPFGVPDSGPVTSDTLSKGKEFKAAGALQALKEVGTGATRNLKNILKGTTETPYNFFGGAADIGNLALMPFGLDSKEPALGSAHLKRLATEAGIRPAPPTDPRDAGFYMMGELGASALNPADVVRKGVQATQATTAGVKKAADLLRDLKKPKEVLQTAPAPAPMAGPTPEVQTELAQLTEQRGLPRNAGQAPDPLIGVRPTVEEAQANVAARQAEPLPPPPAEVVVPQEMLEMPPVAPPMQAGMPVERPFVGRLDAFIDTIKNPVQLGQLKGQLKGKFRDYDIERVERAFPGMDDKTKLTPDQIKQALAGVHSPQKWISETVQPKAGVHYQNTDNVWEAPLGTTNLYLEQAPEALAANDLLKKAAQAFNPFLQKTTSSVPTPEALTQARALLSEPEILKIVDPELISNLSKSFDKVEKNVGLVKEYSGVIKNVQYGFSNPILYVDEAVASAKYQHQPFFKFKEEAMDAEREALRQRLLAGGSDERAARSFASHQININFNTYDKNAEKIASFRVQELAIAEGQKHGIFVDLPDVSLVKWDELNNVTRPMEGNTAFKESVENALEPARVTLHEATKNIKRVMDPEIKKVGDILYQRGNLYEGKHPKVASKPYPIGFTRFSEHEATVPGMGEVQGRHFHELQSDLSKDMRKSGTTFGNAAKDQAEYNKLQNEVQQSKQKAIDKLQVLQQEKRDKIRAGELPNTRLKEIETEEEAIRKSLDTGIRAMEKRIYILGGRVRDKASYSLQEPFAGFETNPMVRQQLLMKNAIQSAMRDGKGFATFPGAESNNPNLYVGKVQPNLKQVIKDLGGEKSGLELRQIELPPDKDGRPITATGVVWSPEAAARIMKTGVPFAKGGSVERLSADTRRYL